MLRAKRRSTIQVPLVSDAASSGYRQESRPPRLSVQAAVDTTGEHAGASSGKVHPAMDGPAPANSRGAECEQSSFRPLPPVASRFDAVAP